MSTSMDDSRFDVELRHFLAARMADTSGILSADAMAVDIARRVGLHRPGDRPGSSLALAVALLALMALLVATTLLAGSQRRREVSPVPTTRVPATATLTWTRIVGVLKPGIFETPDGYAAFIDAREAEAAGWLDSSLGAIPETGYEQSVDGSTWLEGQIPVPGEGPFGHLEAGGEHWIWSRSQMRAWRSPDYRDWAEVDLGAIGRPTSDMPWTLDLGPGVANGSTTLIPWRTAAGEVARSGLLVVAGERVESFDPPWGADAALASIGGRFVALRAPRSTGVPGAPGFAVAPAIEAGIWDSTDGRTWTYLGSPDGLPRWVDRSVELVDGTAAGSGVSLVAILSATVQSRRQTWPMHVDHSELWGSDDGLAWHRLSASPGTVFAVEGGFIAVDLPRLHTSPDGRAWEPVEGISGAMGYEPWSRPQPYRAGPTTVVVPAEPGFAWVTWLLGLDTDG